MERSPDRLSYTLSQNDYPLLVATYSTTTSELVFSAGTEGCERHGASYAGSLVGNLSGTMFTLYDDGVRVAGEEVPVPVHRRVELCVISYQTNMMGAEPRQFTIDLDRTLNERTRRPECHIVNKPPVWNHGDVMVLGARSPTDTLTALSSAIGGHCLDFGQYVKAASKKNFQMIRTHTRTSPAISPVRRTHTLPIDSRFDPAAVRQALQR